MYLVSFYRASFQVYGSFSPSERGGSFDDDGRDVLLRLLAPGAETNGTVMYLLAELLVLFWIVL